jgi:small-conductance mechanosensitive channel
MKSKLNNIFKNIFLPTLFILGILLLILIIALLVWCVFLLKSEICPGSYIIYYCIIIMTSLIPILGLIMLPNEGRLFISIIVGLILGVLVLGLFMYFDTDFKQLIVILLNQFINRFY